MEQLTVKIKRTGGFQEYRLEIESFGTLSVLNVLEELYRTRDKTLAFFHHAACRQAACGKCLMKINGKKRLACKELVTTDTLVLEPASDTPVKDLV